MDNVSGQLTGLYDHINILIGLSSEISSFIDKLRTLYDTSKNDFYTVISYISSDVLRLDALPTGDGKFILTYNPINPDKGVNRP